MTASPFLTTSLEYGGKEVRVVEDADLLAWAAAEGLAPWVAQREALLRGILPVRYLKNLWAITLEEQKVLAESAVFVLGCGGLGGTVAQLLVRAGVGHLVLCDDDLFCPSNLNRQWFSHAQNIGRLKASEAAAQCLRLNPLIRVTVHEERFRAEKAEAWLSPCRVAVDALDNLETRFVLEKVCRSRNIPWIHGAVAGWFGQVSTFLPSSPVGLEAIYGARRERSEVEQALGVPGPTPAVIGSLQATEVLRILTGRPPAYDGRLLYYDGETGTFHMIPLGQTDAHAKESL
ncbi:HesA/MoeB/ThiF family protein [Desulfosoma caldarium]|uniref:Molybdopterin/thiamine biosynthesis adenylyltransferase n=1 Tax=Desulfosoma caldarium TaxID=610254 RepID=A0A3N1ULC8_9BACT|nr:HesA/MoeB/ThiF family protein [Desulfosoma caldarium]ROQ92032.1 molybdopterin/thiamine biosynthesis adenylyltransferase [Desulfosoma caldarium]